MRNAQNYDSNHAHNEQPNKVHHNETPMQQNSNLPISNNPSNTHNNNVVTQNGPICHDSSFINAQSPTKSFDHAKSKLGQIANDFKTPCENSTNEIDNQESLIQNNTASSQRTSSTTNPSSSNQCTTTSTKDDKEIGLSTINKSLLMKQAIEHVKVTHPTNASANDCK